MKVFTHYTDNRTPVLSDDISMVSVADATARRISTDDSVKVCELIHAGNVIASYEFGVQVR